MNERLMKKFYGPSGYVPPGLDKQEICVTGIHLLRLDPYVVVRAEINGKWVDVIRECLDGQFSHIVEPEGMMDAAEST